MENRVEKAKLSLAKAREAFREARVLLDSSAFSGAISRAYYAMFHAATAALASRSLEFSKHSAVISAFGSNFARTGLIEKEYHQMLLKAFESREAADYDIYSKPEREWAENAVHQAERFLERIAKFLESEVS